MVAPKISPVLGFLRDLEVLPSVETEGLRLFGLRRDIWQRKAPRLSHLRDGMEAGSVVIRRVDTHAGPPSIWIMNEGDRRLLISSGEPLPGISPAVALTASLVVEARETLRVPPGLLVAIPSTENGEAPGYPSALRSASGVVFARGRAIIGLALFERSESLRRAWAWLCLRPAAAIAAAPTANSTAAAISTVAAAADREAGPPLRMDEIIAWLDHASTARIQVRPSPGLGQEIELRNEHLHGRALLLDGVPIHVEVWDQSPAASVKTSPEASLRPSSGTSDIAIERVDGSGQRGDRYLPSSGAEGLASTARP